MSKGKTFQVITDKETVLVHDVVLVDTTANSISFYGEQKSFLGQVWNPRTCLLADEKSKAQDTNPQEQRK